jgi:hypothetical protein
MLTSLVVLLQKFIQANCKNGCFVHFFLEVEQKRGAKNVLLMQKAYKFNAGPWRGAHLILLQSMQKEFNAFLTAFKERLQNSLFVLAPECFIL